jgi:hypothetical protein
MPTFAFPIAPTLVTQRLLRYWNAPLPLSLVHRFGNVLNARLLSMLCRSTSELLRTL